MTQTRENILKMRAYYNEHDLKAAAWLDMLSTCGEITTGDVDPRDIQKVRIDDLRDYDRCHFFAGIGGWDYALRLAGWPATRPVWTASLPCQPFSAAGKQRGTEDERHLWPVFRDLVEECRPAILFGEQVASKPGRAWLASVQTDLEALGYITAAADLCAASIGAPHIRQRLYWCALRVEYPESVGQCSDKLERNSESGESLERAGEGRNLINGREVSGVAYLETGRRGQVHSLARGRDEGSGAQGGERLEHCSGAGGLAYRECDGFNGCGEAGKAGGHEPTDGGIGGGLAHSSSTGLEIEREQPAREECAPVERGGAAGGLPHTESLVSGRDIAQWEQEGGTPDRRNSAWDDVIYVPCADGKARPIKPGIEPLVDGLPGRVGLLRGYGNAIVPQVAAIFIQSVMEAVSC